MITLGIIRVLLSVCSNHPPELSIYVTLVSQASEDLFRELFGTPKPVLAPKPPEEPKAPEVSEYRTLESQAKPEPRVPKTPRKHVSISFDDVGSGAEQPHVSLDELEPPRPRRKPRFAPTGERPERRPELPERVPQHPQPISAVRSLAPKTRIVDPLENTVSEEQKQTRILDLWVETIPTTDTEVIKQFLRQKMGPDFEDATVEWHGEQGLLPSHNAFVSIRFSQPNTMQKYLTNFTNFGWPVKVCFVHCSQY